MINTEIKYIWKAFDELSSDELYAMIHLRQKVFIVEQDCPYIDADYTDQDAFHLLVYKNNDLIGYLRAFKPGIKYEGSSLGRIVTEINSRGLGIGKEITNTRAKKSPVMIKEVSTNKGYKCPKEVLIGKLPMTK